MINGGMKAKGAQVIRFFYEVRFLKKFGIEAIVLYPFVLFASNQKNVSEALFRHELEHVYQIERDGFISFYVRYLMSYLRQRRRGLSHFQAYLQIPYEVEARKAESKSLDPNEVKLWRS